MPVGPGYKSNKQSSSLTSRRDLAGSHGQSSTSSAPGKQVFSLIANQHNSSKTVLLVKCTDTSINAFNRAIEAHKKHGGTPASITFKSGGGVLNLPMAEVGADRNAEERLAMRSVNFRTSKLDQAGGLECLVQRALNGQKREKNLVSIGDITLNARIEGTEEIFQQTKEKMNQVEEDWKKVSTKTIDNFGKNKLSGISKKRTGLDSGKSKLMMEAAAMARPAYAVSRPLSTSSAPSSMLSRHSNSSSSNLSSNPSFSGSISTSAAANRTGSPVPSDHRVPCANPSQARSHQTFEKVLEGAIARPTSSTGYIHSSNRAQKDERSLPTSKGTQGAKEKQVLISTTSTVEEARSSPIDKSSMTDSRHSANSSSSGSNSNSPKSTSAPEKDYSLQDHVVYQLLGEDSNNSNGGGLTVSSLTFKLKAQCKIKNVQYQNVVSVLNQVASPSSPTSNSVYALKKPQHALAQLANPLAYPFYTQSQKEIVQRKLQKLGNHSKESDSVEGSGSQFRSDLSNSSGLSQSSSSGSGRLSSTGTESSGKSFKTSEAAAKETLECFKDLIESTSTQRKRSLPASNAGSSLDQKLASTAGAHPHHHQTSSDQSGQITKPGSRCNSTEEAKRPRHNDTLGSSGVTKAQGGLHDSSRGQRLQTDRVASTMGHADKRSADEGHAHSTLRRVSPESDTQMTPLALDLDQSFDNRTKVNLTGQKADVLPGEKKSLVFAPCLVSCKFCIDDPLRDFEELKSMYPVLTSRDEFYRLQHQFQTEYYGEFLPLRKKVTETKRLFKKLKEDFDSAKAHFAKLEDSENKSQLEQMADNVIQAHQQLFLEGDFLKTNHRCNQLHNQLSVMLSRLQDYQHLEFQLLQRNKNKSKQQHPPPFMLNPAPNPQSKIPAHC